MVIHNLNIFRFVAGPFETNSPLVVDAYAVLSLAVAFQRLEAIAGRNQQILQAAGLAQLQQLAPRRPLDRAEAGHRLIAEQRLRLRRTEGLDHPERVLRDA